MTDILNDPKFNWADLGRPLKLVAPIKPLHQRTPEVDEWDDEEDVCKNGKMHTSHVGKNRKNADVDEELDNDWPNNWLNGPEPKPKKVRRRMPNGVVRPNIAVRISTKQLAKIDKLAAKEMKRRSDVLRELINKALKQVG